MASTSESSPAAIDGNPSAATAANSSKPRIINRDSQMLISVKGHDARLTQLHDNTEPSQVFAAPFELLVSPEGVRAEAMQANGLDAQRSQNDCDAARSQ